MFAFNYDISVFTFKILTIFQLLDTKFWNFVPLTRDFDFETSKFDL